MAFIVHVMHEVFHTMSHFFDKTDKCNMRLVKMWLHWTDTNH